MKKIILYSLVLFGLLNTALVTAQSSKSKPKTYKSKDKDGIDGRMKGPNGETVYIGHKGGRYYINSSGNKIYIQRKKKK
jgi:hypothetical protein